jgi:CDGSH-type Zn-finger protein
MATITVRQNGPYLIDGDDISVIDWNGASYLVERRPLALCRCGASAKRPFCDGKHNGIGFSATEGAGGE